MIDVRELSRTFTSPAEVAAVADVSLNVARGDYIAIMGASGSGKSTLLNLLGLLDTADSGSYVLSGHDVSSLSVTQRAAIRSTWIGFVFQQFHLTAHRSAVDNVAMGLVYQGTPRPKRRAMAEEALNEVGLSGRLDASPRTLSGGEQQRVAIARALAGSRRLLLCDEPTGNLDSETTQMILTLFDRIRTDQRTIVVVTHDDEVAAAADRRFVMRDGHLHEIPDGLQ